MPADDVDFDVDITDGRTEITLEGQQDAVVIVRSESGERIYLPPDGFEEEPSAADQSPYQGVRSESSYQRAEQSPYESSQQSSYGASRNSPGIHPTRTGYRVVHPEPVTELRLLRAD
jgi:hypothetical protein